MNLLRHDFLKFKEWYEGPFSRTPLVIFGARQVGKSTMAYDFAKSTGRKVFVVNFWKDQDGKFQKIFKNNKNAKNVLSELELYFDTEIDEQNSILILDEIQSCVDAYSLCKSFKEDTSIPVIATGSYLKLYLQILSQHDTGNFINPVGCTHEITLHPLTFSEYLQNRSRILFDKFEQLDLHTEVPSTIHEKLLDCYFEYLFVGGMPEVVSVFLEEREKKLITAIKNARTVQKNLLDGYRKDFLIFRQNSIVSKNVSEKLVQVFDSIATELYKSYVSQESVGRYKFSSIGKKIDFKRIANVFEYLSFSGLIIQTYFIKKPQLPLFTSGEGRNHFKCFYSDIGLLNAQLGIDYQDLVEDRLNYYKGSITENFIAQELHYYLNEDLLTWANENYEVEFIFKIGDGLVPLEVKSSVRNHSSVSLDKYIKKYRPSVAYKVSPKNFGKNTDYFSIPIYFMGKLFGQ